MDKKKLHQYAEVVVKKALQLKKDQILYVEALLETSEFVYALAEEAYKVGAAEVAVNWKSNRLEQIKLLSCDGPQIGKLSELDYATIDYYAQKGAAFVRIESPDLDIFKDVPTEKIQRKALGDRESRNRYREKSQGTGAGSTIICVPTAPWAKVVFPNLPEAEALEKLWEYVFTCVRVNESDPLKAWNDFVANTRKRRSLLNAKKYVTFHYKSPVTDLYMSPIDEQFWCGGCNDTDDPEVYCIPNVPTEEVFTCPHKYKVNGYVTSTMPLNYRGRIINDFRLTLKDGKVVDYSAKEGEDVLKTILETDDGSCYFGEMALIDTSSPISRLHTTFYTTLYDENASCHIALGLGLGGSEGMTPEEREANGINTSALHVDFMVGSPDLNIQGQLPDGTWEDVFINGSWAPAFQI